MLYRMRCNYPQPETRVCLLDPGYCTQWAIRSRTTPSCEHYQLAETSLCRLLFTCSMVCLWSSTLSCDGIDPKIYSHQTKTACCRPLQIRDLSLFYQSLGCYSAEISTITTCSVALQSPHWLSCGLSRPGSTPTTLRVTHKELRMGGDVCVSP